VENAQDRRALRQGAGDRGMVIHDGKGASFCRSCRFVCSFIAHFPPFLPTWIILVRFFLPLNIRFPHVYCLFFAYFLILLPLQRNDPNPQTHSLLLRFCGYHRRTEIHVTVSCACFVGPDHDLSGGCIGSALSNVFILLDANSKSRSTTHIR